MGLDFSPAFHACNIIDLIWPTATVLCMVHGTPLQLQRASQRLIWKLIYGNPPQPVTSDTLLGFLTFCLVYFGSRRWRQDLLDRPALQPITGALPVLAIWELGTGFVRWNHTLPCFSDIWLDILCFLRDFLLLISNILVLDLILSDCSFSSSYSEVFTCTQSQWINLF